MRGPREKCSPELLQTMTALARIKNIWIDKNIRIKYKRIRALIITIFLYACETWTLTTELQRRIQLLELRCLRKILGISYKDRITNEHVRKTIIKHMGLYEDLLATVKRRKLKWYGHLTRSDSQTKVILQGTVEGQRIRGMPKKRWIDNIAERTGKSFAETSSHGTHRQEWRELTDKSIMTRGAMGSMHKACRSVEYVVWCVIRLNNTATPVCIEIHLGRTLSYNEHNTKDKTTKCPQHHHRQACKFEVDNFTNANTNSMLSRPLLFFCRILLSSSGNDYPFKRVQTGHT